MKKNRRDRSRNKRLANRRPSLKFTPTAWAKLLFLRDYGETEIGAFGITGPNNLLLIEDVQLVRQICSFTHVAFDDEAVADFFDDQVDTGRKPEQFARIWLHTHPGDCPYPSQVDEETLTRVFGSADWAVMFILAQAGNSYARLCFHSGPGVDVRMRLDIDYTRPFPACDEDAWEAEYLLNVHPEVPQRRRVPQRENSDVHVTEHESVSLEDFSWPTAWPERWPDSYGLDDSDMASQDFQYRHDSGD